MSDTVISVENLGKKYRIRHQQRERYTALRDVITEKFKSVLRTRHSSPATRPSTEDFWALKDVSFEVKQRRSPGHYWPKWRGEINAAKDPQSDYRTDRGPGSYQRASRKSAGGGHGLSSRADRAGKHLP